MTDAAIKEAVREAHEVIRNDDLGPVRGMSEELATVRTLIAALRARGIDDLARALEKHEDGIVNALVEEHGR